MKLSVSFLTPNRCELELFNGSRYVLSCTHSVFHELLNVPRGPSCKFFRRNRTLQSAKESQQLFSKYMVSTDLDYL